MKLSTDAPSDWPALELSSLGVNNHLNAVNIAKELINDFKNNKKDYIVSSFLESLLLDQGILQTHIKISDSSKNYFIFIFPDNEESSSRFYAGIKLLFSNTDKSESVYYSNFNLDLRVKPALPLRQFGPDLFTKLGKSTPEGTYSVWHNTGGKERFTESDVFRLISEYQGLSHGIQSYLLAEILRSVNDIEDNVGRVILPEEEYSMGLLGPENKPIILSASKKQGLMFHFSDQKASSRYRTLFWKLFNVYVNELKEYIEKEGIEKDMISDGTPKQCWDKSISELQKKESSGELIGSFGVF